VVISLVIDFGELAKVAPKGKVGKWVEGCWRMYGDYWVFLICVWVYFSCFSGGYLCQGLQRVELGTVGATGGKCVGGMGSMVTVWWRIEGVVKMGERVDEKGQKE
jgi:hypothetical protein